MEETGRAGRRRGPPFDSHVFRPMVVVSAGRDEGRVFAVAVLELEAEHAAVEVERPVEVRDFEVHVPDVHAGVDRAWRHLGRSGGRLHAAIVLQGAHAPEEPERALYLRGGE